MPCGPGRAPAGTRLSSRENAPGVGGPQARLRAPVGASRKPRYPRSVTEPAPPLACPQCSEPMQLATKRIRKRGLKPGQRVERSGDEQRVRIWVCHRCGIQRRASSSPPGERQEEATGETTSRPRRGGRPRGACQPSLGLCRRLRGRACSCRFSISPCATRSRSSGRVRKFGSPANRRIARDGPEFGTPQRSHEESVRVPTGDLLRVSEAKVADICVD